MLFELMELLTVPLFVHDIDMQLETKTLQFRCEVNLLCRFKKNFLTHLRRLCPSPFVFLVAI